MARNANATDRALRLTSAWRDMVNGRVLNAVPRLFAENAVFTATAPAPLVGVAAIRSYYENAPVGLSVEVDLIAATTTANALSIATAVRFMLADGKVRRGRLSLTAMPVQGQDRIVSYQVCLDGS